MARYTITYKCGHTAEVQLYGKTAEREKKIAWYRTIDCPDCQDKEAKEVAMAAGLPLLTGSEKQIAWATRIRNTALDVLEKEMPNIKEEMRDTFIGLRSQWLNKENSASYWIENRDDFDDARYIINAILKSTNFKA
ncbi:MAG: hypothetical protein HDR88_10360 [Bacteroides sp.]|nr:hypothetical protein [Bacteroides sp.]